MSRKHTRGAVFLIILPMLGCTPDPTYIVEQKTSGATVRTSCGRQKIELGLLLTSPIPELHNGEPAAALQIDSTITVKDASKSELIKLSRSKPIVLWFGADGRNLDRIGLQEVTLPWNFKCKQYTIDISYGPLPEQVMLTQAQAPRVYARKSRRP